MKIMMHGETESSNLSGLSATTQRQRREAIVSLCVHTNAGADQHADQAAAVVVVALCSIMQPTSEQP